MVIFLFIFAAICFTLSFLGFAKLKKQKEEEFEKQRSKDEKIKQHLSNTIQLDISTIQSNYSFERHSQRSKIEKPEYMKYIRARKLVEDYVVLDFETTGLNVLDSQIIQIGAVKYKNHQVVDHYNTYVNPQRPLSSKIITITGITDDLLKDAPLIDEVFPELINFIGDYDLVAHNASFDMKFLLHNMNECGLPYKKFRVIDTLSLARKNIHTHNHKLVTLKEYLNLDHYDSHDALQDCYVTAEVYKYCYEKSLVTL